MLVVLALGVCAAQSPNGDLPPWARGGIIGAKRARLLGPRLASTESWLSVPLDHFNPTEERYFHIRYYVNENWFNPSEPKLFLTLGGEGPTAGLREDFVSVLAQQHGALLVTAEHRFYGESLPEPLPEGYSLANLKFLTVEQALADFATLIEELNVLYPGVMKNTFTFGGSYSGALSAWFRMTYPNHTRGSLSSSGVVNVILNMVEFDEHVASVIPVTCASALRRATWAFEDAIDQGNLKQVLKMFNVSTNMSDTDFYFMIADATAMAVQYNHKADLCNYLGPAVNASNATLMLTVADFVKSYWGPEFASGCFYSTDCVANGPANKWVGGSDRLWRWQTCSELAYLQSAPAVGSLRSKALTIEVLLEQCDEMFGQRPNTTAINQRYGGATPSAEQQNATQIFFTNFSDDPWLEAGVRKQLSASLPFSLVTCDGCGHCLDLRAPSPSDVVGLKETRLQFEQFLQLWTS